MSHQRPRTGLELIQSTVRDVFNECADENEAYDRVWALVFVSSMCVRRGALEARCSTQEFLAVVFDDLDESGSSETA
jgi:hypothetical protein